MADYQPPEPYVFVPYVAPTQQQQQPNFSLTNIGTAMQQGYDNTPWPLKPLGGPFRAAQEAITQGVNAALPTWMNSSGNAGRDMASLGDAFAGSPNMLSSPRTAPRYSQDIVGRGKVISDGVINPQDAAIPMADPLDRPAPTPNPEPMMPNPNWTSSPEAGSVQSWNSQHNSSLPLPVQVQPMAPSIPVQGSSEFANRLQAPVSPTTSAFPSGTTQLLPNKSQYTPQQFSPGYTPTPAVQAVEAGSSDITNKIFNRPQVEGVAATVKNNWTPKEASTFQQSGLNNWQGDVYENPIINNNPPANPGKPVGAEITPNYLKAEPTQGTAKVTYNPGDGSPNTYSYGIEGDPMAYVNLSHTKDGIANINQIQKGNQPAGSGGKMLVDAFQQTGNPRPTGFSMNNVINKSTTDSLNDGKSVYNTNMGNMIQNAADLMGGRVENMQAVDSRTGAPSANSLSSAKQGKINITGDFKYNGNDTNNGIGSINEQQNSLLRQALEIPTPPKPFYGSTPINQAQNALLSKANGGLTQAQITNIMKQRYRNTP